MESNYGKEGEEMKEEKTAILIDKDFAINNASQLGRMSARMEMSITTLELAKKKLNKKKSTRDGAAVICIDEALKMLRKGGDE